MRYLAALFAKSTNSLRGLFLRWRSGGYYVEPTRCAWPTGKERYGLDEKPEGWNDAVLGHFHGSPDARERSPAFSTAFKERAHSNIDTRLGRTLALAHEFRQAAIKLPAEPEPGTHPVIHEAMRRSFLIQAEELEREAEDLRTSRD